MQKSLSVLGDDLLEVGKRVAALERHQKSVKFTLPEDEKSMREWKARIDK